MLKHASYMSLSIQSISIIAMAVITTMATSPLALADKDPDLQRTQDSINNDSQKKEAVRTDSENKRISVETKSGKGVYVEGGGKPPSHDNPKGEKKVGAGVQIRFGGSDK